MSPNTESTMTQPPFVSCIMPTYNRRRYVPQAIAYFRRQDYPERELIIVDDGTDPIRDLVPDDPCIRYLRLDHKRTIGAKRNLACQEAKGDIIAHWDDDDWMAPHRLSYQVDTLLRERAEICGLRCMLFYDLTTGQTWLYEYPANQRLWLVGGSLLYTREFWRCAPFLNIQVGEDTRFLWNRRVERAVTPPEYSFYVAMIHPNNTSRKVCQGTYWSRWLGDLQRIMGDDLGFYQPLRGNQRASGGIAMKLNLGCCDAPLPGFTNVDLVPGPGIEGVDLAGELGRARACLGHHRTLA
jgi:glycosyltransferase involved in cell wall biosynthesis